MTAGGSEGLPDDGGGGGPVRTLMIWSWTPSSVCGPWKQLQMVSTSRSISLLPGVLLSGALPVMWPYAISFYGQTVRQVCVSVCVSLLE